MCFLYSEVEKLLKRSALKEGISSE